MRVGSDQKKGNWCEAKKTELNFHYIRKTDVIYSYTVDHVTCINTIELICEMLQICYNHINMAGMLRFETHLNIHERPHLSCVNAPMLTR